MWARARARVPFGRSHRPRVTTEVFHRRKPRPTGPPPRPCWGGGTGESRGQSLALRVVTDNRLNSLIPIKTYS